MLDSPLFLFILFYFFLVHVFCSSIITLRFMLSSRASRHPLLELSGAVQEKRMTICKKKRSRCRHVGFDLAEWFPPHVRSATSCNMDVTRVPAERRPLQPRQRKKTKKKPNPAASRITFPSFCRRPTTSHSPQSELPHLLLFFLSFPVVFVVLFFFFLHAAESETARGRSWTVNVCF